MTPLYSPTRRFLHLKQSLGSVKDHHDLVKWLSSMLDDLDVEFQRAVEEAVKQVPQAVEEWEREQKWREDL